MIIFSLLLAKYLKCEQCGNPKVSHGFSVFVLHVCAVRSHKASSEAVFTLNAAPEGSYCNVIAVEARSGATAAMQRKHLGYLEVRARTRRESRAGFTRS